MSSDTTPAKKQDIKAVDLVDDDDNILEFDSLFAPMQHTLPSSVATSTRKLEDRVTSLTAKVTRIAADRDFDVQEVQELIEHTEKIGELIGAYVDSVQRASGRRGPAEQESVEVEDD